jgi:secernin
VCDCLVALPSATDGPFTLFAKNSDRPPAEPQEVAWSPARRDDGPLRVTHISVDPYPAMTVGCLLSRPAWCWGAEHGVNEAGVAIGNATVYTTLDPRPAPPALVGMDLVRLALERSTCAKEAVGPRRVARRRGAALLEQLPRRGRRELVGGRHQRT